MSDVPKFFAKERFQVIQRIGDGFTGSVFLAVDEGTDEKVAIKYASNQTSADTGLLQRFDLEIKLLEDLNHRNLVKHITHGYENGRPYLVMEFIEGVSFDKWIMESQKPIRIAEVLIQLLEGMKYLHLKGIVHRDLKPQNLMITNTIHGFHLKIIDFGFARLFDHSERITMTGEIVGSPAYIAPEQIRSNEKIDHRADIFAFGIIAFQAFTNQLPFTGNTPSEMAYSIFSDQPKNFKDFYNNTPDELIKIINSCLKKKVYNRPMSTALLIQEFQDILEILKTSK